MRNMRKFVLAAAMLLMATSVNAQRHIKYFGFWANDGYQAENQATTNITFIWTGEDNYNWDDRILTELAEAKRYGNKAIVSVGSYLFDAPGGGAPYKIDPAASVKFAQLVDKMIAGGYLVPGNPEASTAHVFYVVDEPELKGLQDQYGAAHPALINAVNAVRQNPNTSNFPIAVIGGYQKYPLAMKGIQLFDWAGLDHYPGNTGDYMNAFATFTSQLRPEQLAIVVPQAATGGDLDNETHDPNLIYVMARNHYKTVLVMPFLYPSGGGRTGTRDIPHLRSWYASYGATIKYGLAAEFAGLSVPTTMVAGQTYQATINFKNTGSGTWNSGYVNLGSQNWNDNTIWGMHRVSTPGWVGPDQIASFNFTVRAPTSPGSYNFQWRMVADGLSWFGDLTPNQVIQVIPAPTGSISANPNPCAILVYYGATTCQARINWNSNRSDAEVWVSAPDGSGPQLFARGQNGAQNAPWITTATTRFTLKSGGVAISHVDVSGWNSYEEPPPPPPCPGCVEP